MAELSSRDVVNQVRSTDASASVDVSASTITTLGAAAAKSTENTPNQAISTSSATGTSPSEANPDVGNVKQSGEGSHAETQEKQTPLSDDKNTDNTDREDAAAAGSESGARSASGSVGQSALSEGETGQTENAESKAKGGDAAARNAIKKPSTFKAVSVTKSFLAKAGAPVSPANKLGSDSTILTSATAGSFATNSARPRLIAKTGSGHKLSMSTQLSSASKPGNHAGPDPMQVWNRNRVQAPQATPKHLTNEELREQYGIQLASIPIGDGDDKGNKWADIDDEEDDWAPDVIEWSDGSKVNLADAQSKAAAEKEKAAEEAKKREEAARAAAIAARSTHSLGPKATVLKVGGGSQTKGPGDAAASSRPSEKPALVAKPVVPTPVKSPWATLPPVDKVPPVTVNPPAPMAMQGHNRFQQSEGASSDRGPAPWRHAREMEADDFSRMPRGSPNSVPRELFNSHSGKYEPVTEGRRGSVKRDQNFRPPAVLQRPGPDQDGQASVVHRRDSEAVASTVSEEASSLPQPNDPGNEPESAQPWRRQPGTWMSSRGRSDSQAAEAPGQPTGSSSDGVSNQPPVAQPPSADGQPQEDAVVVQKRLMREKREAAIKRRQEEEAKEEAERKERIRKKLEAMGPPPEKKKEKPSSTDEAISTDLLPSPAPAAAATPVSAGNQEIATAGAPSKDEITRSPPKPPLPSTSGPPQQYGMLKIHPTPLPNGAAGSMPPPPQPKSSAAPKINEGMSRFAARPSPPSHSASAASASSNEITRSESTHQDKGRWSHAANQNNKGWERPSEVQNMVPSSSLWGSGPHNRNLGNGDFNSLNPPRGQFRQQQISPENILPSPQSVPPARLFHEEKASTPTPVGAHLIGAPGFAQKVEPGNGGISPFAAEISPAGPQSRTPSNQNARTPRLPSPVAPNPNTHGNMQPGGRSFGTLPEPRPGIDAWANFSTNVGDHDTSSRARLMQDRNKQIADSHAHSGQQPGRRQFNETWKQVTHGDDLGTRQIINTHITTRSQAHHQNTTGVQEEAPRHPAVTMPPQHPRSSRFHTFFGQHEPVAPPHAPIHQVRSRDPARSASPPPPDSVFHPVFDRMSYRPRVRLPGQGHGMHEYPRPIVKLPPSRHLPQHPIVAELRGMPPPLRGPAQPLAKTLDWQHRFDGLLNRSPEKRVAEPLGFSSSKSTFDIVAVNEAASVHFPRPGQISPVSPRFATLRMPIRTIDQEEALFDGEQIPGSTPPVRVPANKYPAGWRPAPSPSPRRMPLTDSDIFSRFTWIVGLEDFQGKKVTITVKLTGMREAKKLDLVNSNIQNPRMFSKTAPPQKSKVFAKPARKPREPQGRQGPLQPATNKGAPYSAPAKPAAATPPAPPTTWAKRVSANI